MAVLSFTDCSTYSGGSTASSDITDPGSPFSTTSSHSEDSASQPAKMPPNLTAHHPPWPWSGGDSPPLKRTTTQKTVSPKRLKTDPNPTLPAAEHKRHPKKDSGPGHKPQQGKITEYFKTQMKTSNGAKKELAGLLIKATNVNKEPPDVQNYFTLLDGQKVILNGKCTKIAPDLYNKYDVLGPVKKVVLDTKTRKISQLISVPRKILPGPKPDKKPTTPTVKLTTLRFQPDANNKCTVKPLDNLFIDTASKLTSNNNNNNINNKVSSAIVKRNNNNNTMIIPVLQKVITQVSKVNSTVVPIVKLNNMPSKLNGSNNNNNNNHSNNHNNNNNNVTSLSVDTAVPTVPSAKPKLSSSSSGESGSKALSIPEKPLQKLQLSPKVPIETTQQKKCKMETSPDSDSGVSVRDLLSVSVTVAAGEIEPQKSPILSQPKTIRFPAKQSMEQKEQRTEISDSGVCRWQECEAQFDTSGALLEHLQVSIFNT